MYRTGKDRHPSWLRMVANYTLAALITLAVLGLVGWSYWLKTNRLIPILPVVKANPILQSLPLTAAELAAWEEARRAASQHFSSPHADNQGRRWAGSRQFGYHRLLCQDLGGCGTIERKADEDGWLYKVELPMSCKATDEAGAEHALFRKVLVDIRQTGGAYAVAGEFKVTEQRPLSFAFQLHAWLFACFVGPLAVMAVLTVAKAGLPFMLALQVNCWDFFYPWVRRGFLSALSTTTLISVPNAAYSAYICFDSALAILPCLIGWVLVGTLPFTVFAWVRTWSDHERMRHDELKAARKGLMWIGLVQLVAAVGIGACLCHGSSFDLRIHEKAWEIPFYSKS